VLALMLDPERASRMGALARSRVLRDYIWRASYARLDALLERDARRHGCRRRCRRARPSHTGGKLRAQ
jgi:hypothetical protein